jgi:nitrite reductase/ring-hydroxylating ferredoxin subunit
MDNGNGMVRVAALAEVRRRGVMVTQAGERAVAVFAAGEEIHAVDNRCPHMGFPLDRGSVKDGILTCHWHEARFELGSGCTFDLWADDAITYATEVRGDSVWVANRPRQARDAAYHRQRLRRGMELGVGLVQAKSLISLLSAGAELAPIVAGVVDYAAANVTSFGEGMVRLTCVARLAPCLSRETLYLGLSYAVRQLADEANAGPARRPRDPLTAPASSAALKGWLGQWVRTRHRDGVERTLLTGVANGLPPADLADLLYGAAAERLYANTGHLFDACNKALELSDLLNGAGPPDLLALLAPSLAAARGEEEGTPWHHPVEIAAAVRAAEGRLAAVAGGGPALLPAAAEDALVAQLLGDDPLQVIAAVEAALRDGTAPAAVGAAVTRAAGLRLARFATSNEVSDWFNPQHTFIFCNAVQQALLRTTGTDVVRALFQAAIAVYMDRYLNVPPARLPAERGAARAATGDEAGGALLDELLQLLDNRAEVERAAELVSGYLRTPAAAWPAHFGRLVDTLAFATLREDLDFHTLQVLEAAATQLAARGNDGGAEEIMVGVVRNLAAHCPTRRAGYQTAMIARRLQRGEEVFAAAG